MKSFHTLISVVTLGMFSLSCNNGSSPSGPETGSIVVVSTPSGAAIFLDGSAANRTTPATLQNVTAGSHTVKLRLTGYSEWQSSVNVTSGGKTQISATLLPAKGNIFVTSTPSGAMIYLDNSASGETTPDTLFDISVGQHAVTTYLATYQASPQQVNVIDKQTVLVNFTLLPITANVTIESFPSGADILIDGTSTGLTTPSSNMSVHVGKREIKLVKSGYEVYQDTFSFNETDTPPPVRALLPRFSKEITGNPDGITVDAAGNMYLAVDYTISKYSPGGALIWSFGSEGNGQYQFKRVSDIQWANGNLFVLDGTGPGASNNRVLRYDENGVFVSSAISLPGTDPTAPSGNDKLEWVALAVDANGLVYVVGDREAYLDLPIRYGVYDSTGNAIVYSGDIDCQNGYGFIAFAAAVDANNFSLLSNYGHHSWPKMSPPGGSTGSFPSGWETTFPQPQDMCLNAYAQSVYYASQTKIIRDLPSPLVYWGSSGSDYFERLAYSNGKIYTLGHGKLWVYDAF